MKKQYKHSILSNALRYALLIFVTLISCNAFSQDAQPRDAHKGEKLIIAVIFTVPLNNREEFKLQITSIFKIIKKQEKKFVSYSVSEDINNPGSILLYEIWDTDISSFGQGPAGKSYFAPFLKALSDLGVSREAHLYKPF